MTPIPERLKGPRIPSDADIESERIKREALSVATRSKILPCPFCGNDPESTLTEHNGGFAIFCKTCEYFGPWASSFGIAVLAWNTRDGK